MAEVLRESGRAALRCWRRWPGWVGYVAAAWSLAYGLLGLYWTLGGAGFPLGSENDPDAALSILGGVRTGFGALVIAALGLVSAVAAVAMARTRQQRGVLRVALLGLAWVAATTLALLIPDYRVLVAVAYTPIILIGALFGWPPGVSILDVYSSPVVNQFICIGGGLISWAATAAAYGRRSRGACRCRCGRDGVRTGWTTPSRRQQGGGNAFPLRGDHSRPVRRYALGVGSGFARWHLRGGPPRKVRRLACGGPGLRWLRWRSAARWPHFGLVAALGRGLPALDPVPGRQTILSP